MSSPLPRRLKPRYLLGLLLAVLVSGCTSSRFETRPPAWADTLREADTVTSAPAPDVGATAEAETTDSAPVSDPDFYRPGSGVLVNEPTDGIARARESDGGEVKLNFQNANLVEVVKVVLGDMLEVNYAVDPAVGGAVSMQTTQPLARDDLLPTLELLLRMNGAALVVENGLYRVVPLAGALAETRAPQLGDSSRALPPGFGVKIVPLRYIGAEEMAQILEPFIKDSNQLLRVDTNRNLLILASAGGQMAQLLDTIEVFDVDRMAGMSVALFTPDFVDAATLAEELEVLLADPDSGLMSGLVRFIVVERLNGIIVVTPQAEHLAQVRNWIRRLDQNTGDAGERLFVYRVQNGKAVEMAETLNALFAKDQVRQEPPELAPGLEAARIGQAPEAEDEATAPPPRPTASRGGAGDGLPLNPDSRVQIIADEANNALLILAKGTEYRQILAALRQLDVSPMQVLVEVTIAEVQLTDNLQFGVEWFFKNRVGNRSGGGLLDLGAAGIGRAVPGFSYLVQNSGDVNFVLNTLASESNLSVISSPSLLVLNNEEASIQVGDEVPVSVQQQQSTAVDANIINSIEYRETGVLLNVKPRINAGGLVIMEVEQEFSQVPSTNNTDPLTPRIKQRRVSSTVAINSGDTIILGGLITENRDLSESGLPGLHKVPVLGSLFGSKADNQDRTELIVLITPRAVANSTAALQVTESFRRRLQKLIPDRAPGAEPAAAN
jgi:general secretion pathway protein D